MTSIREDLTDKRYAGANGQFPHVYWITGGSCSGKSSLADELAEHHGLQVMHTDRIASKLFERADEHRHPVAHTVWPVFKKGFLSWMRLQPSRLYEGIYEIFELLLEDILAMGTDPVVVEGMVISPMAAVEVSSMDRIVCLTGTDDFLRLQEPNHPFVKRSYSEWDDPETALNTLIEGHIQITHMYDTVSGELGIRHIVTDQTTGFEENLRQVEKHFGLI
ncbi:MAG: hypothetical protein HN368_03830 [Spirochaetales bacterium]|jgi:hypothetical protein|nr:hypothetical protein [Spirochaetales bacterium]